jgi:D-3-phosphoglycerate dehydrogenase
MGIKVSYTPEAPAPAVAELTLGLMLSLLRSIHIANTNMHEGQWQRIFGRRIAEVTIGVIGVGRIGSRVIRRVGGFGTPVIMANDQLPNKEIDSQFKINWSTKEEIYRNAEVISFHVPLTAKTKNMVTKEQLLMMKKDALVINTARGGIINENDLADVLNSGHLSGAAIDVFEQEPYHGRLSNVKNCILTSHMGSMSVDCRARMELEAVKEVVRLAKGVPLEALVPQTEYDVQREGL